MDGTSRAKERTLAILGRVFADYAGREFVVRLWDCATWPDGGTSSPAFTLVLNHPGSLRKMFLPPSELSLGEAYIYGDFDVEGDLIAAYSMAEYLQSSGLGVGAKLALARELRALPDDAAAPREGRQAARGVASRRLVVGRTEGVRLRELERGRRRLDRASGKLDSRLAWQEPIGPAPLAR